MKQIIHSLLLLTALPWFLVSCDDDFKESVSYPVEIILSFPSDIQESDVREGSITFKNLSSGLSSEYRYPSGKGISVLTGLYDVEYAATVVSNEGTILTLRGVARSVQIVSSGTLIRIEAYCNLEADDLIISEVFFAGTLQNSGNQYIGDDYVKLYNNTDHVVYADGITLFESKFLTTQKLSFTPDIMNEAVTVQALYTIPGNGQEHPVDPGEYILLADIGIDHRTINPNSFSLEHADWEWYDVSTIPSNVDIDSPTVPNLDKWYCYTQSIWMLHNRGFKAYGIARIPIDREDYLKNYWYSYDYELVTNAGTFPMSQSAYKIPNEWIIDVVNCSVEAEWQWNVTSPKLDMGWTYCGTIDKDKTRYFHAVRRKLLYLREDGTPVFKDTNNSTLDFNSHTTPSEIERQHTVTGLTGETAKIITYDGITPIAD